MSASISLRRLEPEILDELPPADPRAQRARRDLRRVNRLMGSGIILRRALGEPPSGAARPWRLLELGAGDGTLLLRVARSLNPPVRTTAWLLDRQTLLEAQTQAAYRQLGWQVEPLSMEVQRWAALAPEQAGGYDAIVVNLFLHHLDEHALRTVLAASAQRCDRFIACEPRRSALALLGSHLMGLTGASALTRHDALASVRAGFRDRELSQLWPAGPWQIQERRAGLFSHLFVATRQPA